VVKVKIKVSPEKGRGIFAAEDIPKGKLIEKCELILLDFAEVGPVLERYVFHFSGKKAAIALGNGSLYNHNDRPNAHCQLDEGKKILEFKSLEKIPKGSEITINYGYSAEDKLRFRIR
jgi:uncharacterized protein